MILFPAIDVLDGKCVRLIQGDYDKEVIYSDSPVEMAKFWETEGAEFIHIVDLNGAKSGLSVNLSVIQHIAESVSIPVQVGGGIRSVKTIEDYLNKSVNRVILGTAAIQDPEFLKEAVDAFQEKIVVSVDAREGFVATEGWTDTSSTKATDLIDHLEKIGVQTIVYTDIAKDGMLAGPNLIEQKQINEHTQMKVIASGGVTTIEDIQNLAYLNMYGAIIGKALYDERLDFKDALEALK